MWAWEHNFGWLGGGGNRPNYRREVEWMLSIHFTSRALMRCSMGSAVDGLKEVAAVAAQSHRCACAVWQRQGSSAIVSAHTTGWE